MLQKKIMKLLKKIDFKRKYLKSDSFIENFWSWIFKILSWISVLKLIPRFKPSYKFIECWVLFNLLFSILVVFNFITLNGFFSAFILVYGLIRVFEIVVYQVNVLFFDKYRAERKGEKYALKTYLRTVLLLLHNYVEIICWFAYFYLFFQLTTKSACAVGGSFYFMTSFGTEVFTPFNFRTYLLTYCEAAIGLFMALIIIGRFISILPIPESRENS